MSAWDRNWDRIYETQGYRAKYPGEELVRFIAHLYNPLPEKEKGKIKILEVGCGPGANIWYLAREGFSVYGIDGSKAAIKMCKERLNKEGLSAKLTVGDMVKLPYHEEFFQVVVDNFSIQHNIPYNIEHMLSEAHRVLGKDGILFSAVLSTKHYLFGRGKALARNSYLDVADGALRGVGITHFFTIPEIRRIYGKRFVGINIEYIERTIGNMASIIASYIITARK